MDFKPLTSFFLKHFTCLKSSLIKVSFAQWKLCLFLHTFLIILQLSTDCGHVWWHLFDVFVTWTESRCSLVKLNHFSRVLSILTWHTVSYGADNKHLKRPYADKCYNVHWYRQACRHGRTKHVEHLLYFGANINALNKTGNTPLHVCALNNQVLCSFNLI